jgi:L-lactate utilization protein LutC
MSLVLDAGALIALERDDRDTIALLKQELLSSRIPITHGGVVGQVWRSGARQARLARLLPALHIVALDEELGRRAGILLGKARMDDVIDAALVLLAEDGDFIITSDPGDLEPLSQAADVHVDIVPV